MDATTIPTPAQYREHLLINGPSGPVCLDSVLDDWQRADFEALDPSWLRIAGLGEGGHEGFWGERSRGHSKTSDLAVSAAWVLAFSQRCISGVAAAADKDQARLLRNGIAALVRLNGWLDKLLDVKEFRIANKQTGSVLEILSSDAASSYGLTPDFVLVDEISNHARPDLWYSLISSAAKRPGSFVAVITNAGFTDSWQWTAREDIRTDPDWYFNSLDGPKASWITPAVLAKQQRRLPYPVYARLWLNQWSDGAAGSAVDPVDLQAAIKPNLSPLSWPEPHYRYVAGVDLGLTHDSSGIVVLGIHVGGYEATESPESPQLTGTLAAMVDLGILPAPAQADQEIYHEATGRIRLAAVVPFKPPVGGKVSLSQVENEIERLHNLFNLSEVGLDPWQAAQMIERLNAKGINAGPFNFVPKNLQAAATALLAFFRERRLDLFDHEDLTPDLKALRIKDQGGEGFRLVSARKKSGEQGTAHADTATAFSIAAALADQLAQNNTRTIIAGPLLAY